MEESILVCYHDRCYDGFGAAFAAWKKFGDKATYLGINPGNSFPKEVEDHTIYFLDVSTTLESLLELQKYGNRIIILDHHSSTIQTLSNFEFYDKVFDVNRSGAVIAWEYFFPGQPIPEALSYIEDRDLWRHALPRSLEISAFIQSIPFDFAIYNNLCSGPIEAGMIDIGIFILSYQRQEMESIISGASDREINGLSAKVLNYGGKLISDIGSNLAEQADIGVVWRISGDNVFYSFRSKEADVSKLAQRYGGGGHKLASATRMLLSEVPSELKFWEVE